MNSPRVLKQAGTAMASIAPNEAALGPDRRLKEQHDKGNGRSFEMKGRKAK